MNEDSTEPSEADKEAQRHTVEQLFNGITGGEAEQQDKDKNARVNMILNGDPLQFLLDEVKKDFIGDELNVTMCIYSLISLNPCIENLLHMQHVGNVQTGKSKLGLTCESLLKIDMQFPIKHMSPKFLMYSSEKISVKNKLIILDDATDNDIELLKALGNNNGEVTHGTVAHSKAVSFKLDGEPLVWFSTVTPLIDEGNQLNSRYIMLNTDETPIHHKRVLEKFKEELCGTRKTEKIDSITGLLLEACILNTDYDTIMLPPFEYPGGDKMKYRDSKGFTSLVQAIAALNYKKRVLSKMNRILYANQEDIDQATALWIELDRYNLNKLNEQQMQTYEVIMAWDKELFGTPDENNGISIKDIMVGRDRKRAQIYADVKVLQDCGLIYKEYRTYHTIL